MPGAPQGMSRPTPRLVADLVFPNSGVVTPRLVYGTAWKKERTASLVYQALKAGFRGIDTAAQPRHYNEHLVGEGIRRAIRDGIVRREDLFIQTKFTLPLGQDPNNMPYPANASLVDQVHASIASSLRNLTCLPDQDGPEHTADEAQSTIPIIDSLVLHSPAQTLDETLTIWSTLSTYVPHTIRQLGLANVIPDGSVEKTADDNSPPSLLLTHLLTSPSIHVRPAVLQNRFYAATKWDTRIRDAYCRSSEEGGEHTGQDESGGLLYQSFWTLTANGHNAPVNLLARNGPAATLAASANVTPEAALYALVMGLGATTVLDGTTNEARMREDLEGVSRAGAFAEDSEEGERIWEECLMGFKRMIGQS